MVHVKKYIASPTTLDPWSSKVNVLSAPFVGAGTLQLDGQEPLQANTGIGADHKGIDSEIVDKQRDQCLRERVRRHVPSGNTLKSSSDH